MGWGTLFPAPQQSYTCWEVGVTNPGTRCPELASGSKLPMKRFAPTCTSHGTLQLGGKSPTLQRVPVSFLQPARVYSQVGIDSWDFKAPFRPRWSSYPERTCCSEWAFQRTWRTQIECPVSRCVAFVSALGNPFRDYVNGKPKGNQSQ